MNNKRYVILNIYWDSGWLENHVNEASKERVNQRQHNYWTQIVTILRDYDEHLLFAGGNEPM